MGQSAPQFSPTYCVAQTVTCDGGWVCDPAGLSTCTIVLVSDVRVTGDARSNQFFINEGFEDRVIQGTRGFEQIDQSLIPGWSTTDSSGTIELWESGFQNQPSLEGNQFSELNSQEVSTLFQTVNDVPAGLDLSFAFGHAARGTRAGNDVLRLTITDLGPDQTFGTGDDTVLFQKVYSTPTNPSGNNVWSLHDSTTEPAIASPGNALRLSFESVSSAQGSTSYGNFLDQVKLGLVVPPGYDIYECSDVDTVQAIVI
eukprot:CAMPEP_0174888976 /NCGR_PEP_ID=MMETSP0167-20121228/4246_1 /TAXON_ID=38298 /ORGANISM="Rhodella maculata, Strain CCMP736" /LENGTH=255 /DNA_ID=CAMNT_0016126201 /DNA_START=18 /DNA_END=785 /DNA_ORIENTATION=+